MRKVFFFLNLFLLYCRHRDNENLPAGLYDRNACLKVSDVFETTNNLRSGWRYFDTQGIPFTLEVTKDCGKDNSDSSEYSLYRIYEVDESGSTTEFECVQSLKTGCNVESDSELIGTFQLLDGHKRYLFVVTNRPPPRHSSSSCSLGEEVAVCDSNDRGCNESEIDNCSVYCFDACENAEISHSTVECVGQGSCRGATFRQSDVSCSERQEYSCSQATFVASAVSCGADSFTCAGTAFDPCSCCDGSGCPSSIPRCSDSGLQDFCSSTLLGKSCKEWGNPACDA